MTGMENTSYLPGPLASPALMVLASTAAEATRDNPHLANGANSFVQQSTPGGEKGNSAVTTYASAFPSLFQQGEHFAPPLYSPFNHHFLRPGVMDPAAMGLISNTGGAFRPLGPGVDQEGLHSAFVPTKRAKLDVGAEKGDGDSEGSGHLSPPIKDERCSPLLSSLEAVSDTGQSDGTESMDRTTPDVEAKQLRKFRGRRVFDGETPCCPVCGVTLRPGEFELHIAVELDKLTKLSRMRGKGISRETSQGRKSTESPCTNRAFSTPPQEVSSRSRYETYLRIKSNRQSRLNAKLRTRRRKITEENTCPVCNQRVMGSAEELSEHVDYCLKQHQTEGEELPVDVEGYEEYTWAGQTRIRASTLVPGGLAGTGFRPASKYCDDEDMDLVVDGDDSDTYGKPQYSEADVIPSQSDVPAEESERQALRGAILGNNNMPSVFVKERNQWNCSPTFEDNLKESDDDITCTLAKSPSSSNYSEVIAALQARIKQQEVHLQKVDLPHCRICMEVYTKPLTSIQCWHTHCEECWLRTLGAKKLCPQCNMITSSSDLRRVYL